MTKVLFISIMTTSTKMLTDSAKKLFTKDEFLGVFASDRLPKTAGPFNHTSLIVNTDTQNLPGTHWVAIISRENEAYYFDPLGYSPPLMIATWLNLYFATWTCNNRQVQAITSNYCGYFCLHFIYVSKLPYCENIDLNKIINHVYPTSLQYNQYQAIVDDFITRQNL